MSLICNLWFADSQIYEVISGKELLEKIVFPKWANSENKKIEL